MHKLILTAIFIASTLSAEIMTLRTNEIKILLWEDDTGFFNPDTDFSEKSLTQCLIKKNETNSLILCLQEGTNKTFGSQENGTYVDANTFIPENNFLKLKELSVKIGG